MGFEKSQKNVTYYGMEGVYVDLDNVTYYGMEGVYVDLDITYALKMRGT